MSALTVLGVGAVLLVLVLLVVPILTYFEMQKKGERPWWRQ
jgi:Na+-transporting methylmalonyl-CoA/oxaloacetate decarboxylase gamma subunit